MVKRAKKYKEAVAKIDRLNRYSFNEAIQLMLDCTGAKFDETIDRCDRAVDRIAHQIDGVMGFIKESPLEITSILNLTSSSGSAQTLEKYPV